jgi:8-oxo-dGTP pyrophosphatase MutT (NUDIX family)
MQRYVCGFLFGNFLDEVMLIRKTKPEWQAGKVNGIGGKVNPYEKPVGAMRREFDEEAGIYFGQWRPFCRLRGGDWGNEWKVDFFYGVHPTGDLSSLVKQPICDEGTIVVEPIAHNQYRIPNLAWLIPMAIAAHKWHPQSSGTSLRVPFYDIREIFA